MARETFTEQQWQQLVEAAPAVARAVSAAAGSRGKTELELEAFLRLLEETRNDTDGHGLLGELTADIHSRLSTGTLGLQVDDVVADGIHAARQAGALLGIEDDEHDARAVRYWLMEVARTVASASREGGILGIGGRDVSAPEQETMAAIADALGMTEGPDMQRPPSEEEAPDPGAAERPTMDDLQPTDEQPGREPKEPIERAPDGQPVGADNIRDGTVGGVMGGPNRQQGQGQGG